MTTPRKRSLWRHAFWVVDHVHDLFAIPHDWKIVEWPIKQIMRRLFPRTWDYYGNPLCYAYCRLVAFRFYQIEDAVGRRIESP